MKIGAWDFVKEDRKHLYGGLCRVQVFFFICFWLVENKICRGVPEPPLAGGAAGRQPFDRKTGDGLTAASEWDKTVFEEVFG